MTFELSRFIECVFEIDEANTLITTNTEFDILAWGDTFEEAEVAFNFCFYALYHNFCLEIDENLSEEAIELKNELNSLIKQVHEA